MNDINTESGKVVANAITGFVYNVVSERERIAPFNKSLEGIVTAIQYTPKQYTVKIRNTEYPKVKALVQPRAIAVGDKVLCVVENNQMINMTIVGIYEE